MKSVQNCGVSESVLKKGYSSTGEVPDEGGDISNPSELETEIREEKIGFLNRNNTDDRY